LSAKIGQISLEKKGKRMKETEKDQKLQKFEYYAWEITK